MIALPPAFEHEPTDAYPPRFWWLKRIAAASSVLIVLFVALMLVWRSLADRRLNDRIAQLRSSGEPVLIEDFQPVAAVADEENAALTLQAATRAYSLLVPRRHQDF